MAMTPASAADVYTLREIAGAAGVSVRTVSGLRSARLAGAAGAEFVPEPEAVQLVRLLRKEFAAGRLDRRIRLRQAEPWGLPTGEAALPDPAECQPRPLFGSAPPTRRPAAVPLAASGALHVAGLAAILLMSALGVFDPSLSREATNATVAPVRLVFMAQPGPGGGGGGGGLRQPVDPPRAKLKGPSLVSSPVPVRRPPPPVAPPRLTVTEPPRPTLRAEPLPPLLAPVVPVAGDRLDRTGTLGDADADGDSRGPGAGGGVGSGRGTGVGEGDGAGIGPGSGGGIGGGPYHPGSGIEPPRLLREVKPGYTEDARRSGLEGEVLLEIVVVRDGGVGDVRVVRRLGSGLDQRAIEAVKQWRFDPARRQGVPVDVIVEVSVEFKLR
jgi:TonB family protein